MTCLLNLEMNLASGSAAALWVVCSVVLFRITRNNSFAGQLAFVLTLTAMLWWLFTVVLDLASPSETCKIGWSLAAWPGIVVLPVAWTFFVCDYTSNTRERRRTLRLFAYMSPPILVSAIALTNAQTHLLYGVDTRLVTEGAYTYVEFDHGPLFFVVAAGLYIFLVIALGVLAFAFLRAKNVIRPFLAALIIITAAPMAANLSYIAWDLTVFGFDPTPFTFAVSLIALSWLLVNNSMMDTASQGRTLMFYATRDPVILLDADGRLADANPAARNVFREPILHQGMTLDQLDQVGPMLSDLCKTGEIQCLKPIRLGERVFDLRTALIESPIQTKTPLLGWLVSLVDITERERSAEALREALAHAEAANRAKTNFLANVSHEIRTPLNGVLGMVSVLSDTVLDSEQQEYLKVIEGSGQVLLTTIGDVLDLSKIEAEQMVLENSPFVLRDIVKGAGSLFAATAGEKGLTLSVDIEDSLPKVINGDVHRFRQVLHNLVSNAVKFTEVGQVLISATAIDDGMTLLVRVSDTGPGVPDEARDAIFQPFRQADSSDTRKFGGTGLGLSISRELCHLMGGELRLAPSAPKGAVFEIRLPLIPADDILDLENRPDAFSDVLPVMPVMDVLVVDDNKTNRFILEKFLSSSSYRVQSVSSGAEAIELARDLAFDIILMDIQMPGMDGVETTRRIRSLEQAGAREPGFIVAVTANTMPEQSAHYLSAGMDEVLAKPVSKEPFLKMIQTVRRKVAQCAEDKAALPR